MSASLSSTRLTGSGMQSRYADSMYGGSTRTPPESQSARPIASRPPSVLASSSIPSHSSTALSSAATATATSDDRSAAIADYVEKRRQAKLNAESIRKERAREAEMRRLDGRGAAAANTAGLSGSGSPSTSSSPHMPRSGIVTGASSSSTSEASSASSSRRTSRSRGSHEWSDLSPASNGAYADQHHDHTARQREEAREDREVDDEAGEPLNRFAKPLTRAAAPAPHYQQQPHAQSPQHSSARPVSPSPALSVSRSTASSSAAAAAMSASSLQSRVVELEAQVAALQSQHRLFLAFMETTQSQLALIRAPPHTQPLSQHAAPTSTSTASKHTKQQPSPHNSARTSATRFEDNKDDVTDSRGRRVGLYDGRRQEEDERELDGTAPAAYTGGAHSKAAPDVSQRKQPARPTDDTSHAGTHALSTQRASRADEADGEYNRPRAIPPASANTQRALQQPLRTSPSRLSPPTVTSAAPTASALSSPLSHASADVDEADPFPEQSTSPCPKCGRSFNAAALERHVAAAVCQKAARKRFDVAAQRLQEVKAELSQVTATDRRTAGGAGRKAQKDEATAAKQSKWRQERARLQEAIQAGKQLTTALKEGKPLSSIPVAASSVPDDRVQCPHCLRKFAEQTAERHIPHCANTANRMTSKPTAPNAQKRR